MIGMRLQTSMSSHVMTLTGSQMQLNLALKQLPYVPFSNYNGPESVSFFLRYQGEILGDKNLPPRWINETLPVK
jgi:hypothetical protein